MEQPVVFIHNATAQQLALKKVIAFAKRNGITDDILKRIVLRQYLFETTLSNGKGSYALSFADNGPHKLDKNDLVVLFAESLYLRLADGTEPLYNEAAGTTADQKKSWRNLLLEGTRTLSFATTKAYNESPSIDLQNESQTALGYPSNHAATRLYVLSGQNRNVLEVNARGTVSNLVEEEQTPVIGYSVYAFVIPQVAQTFSLQGDFEVID